MESNHRKMALQAITIRSTVCYTCSIVQYSTVKCTERMYVYAPHCVTGIINIYVHVHVHVKIYM